MRNYWLAHGSGGAAGFTKDKNLTFLALPPDLQKPTRRPNTNIASDKDRIAMSRHPELDPKELRKILATPPPGAPGMNGPRAPQPAPQAMAQNQPPAPQQGQQQTPRPQFQSDQTAQLQTPARPNNSFSKYGTGMTPGSGDSGGHGSGGGATGQAAVVRKATSAWAPERTAGRWAILRF